MTKTTFTKRNAAPFRFDTVGSFLRPAVLKQARADFDAKKITQEELNEVENKAIIKLIKQQEEAGLKGITDGEFRRSWWHLDFFWGLTGVSFKDAAKGYNFQGEETRAETATITEKISGVGHPFISHFKFVQDQASEFSEIRQTIPAPAQFYKELIRPENQTEVASIYPTKEELIADIVKAYKEAILGLYDAGCRVIQLDDCTWGMLVSKLPEGVITDGKSEEEVREKLKKELVSINNLVIEGLPDDLTINTHVCRGNYHSTWAASGGYDLVADPLFTEEQVKTYYLEYDTDRSGGFEPLQLVNEDQYVVLGLVTSKTGELEDKEQVITRIKEASQYVPLDHLCISPQCGFASTEEGNVLTEEQQWAKIRLLKEIADEVWGVV